MKLSTKDYKKILKFYKLSIPEKTKNIKKKADKIIAEKFCSCIKKVQQKFKEEGIAIGICTNSVINKKGYKRGKFKCKKRRTINLHKGGKRRKKTRKKRGDDAFKGGMMKSSNNNNNVPFDIRANWGQGNKPQRIIFNTWNDFLTYLTNKKIYGKEKEYVIEKTYIYYKKGHRDEGVYNKPYTFRQYVKFKNIITNDQNWKGPVFSVVRVEKITPLNDEQWQPQQEDINKQDIHMTKYQVVEEDTVIKQNEGQANERGVTHLPWKIGENPDNWFIFNHDGNQNFDNYSRPQRLPQDDSQVGRDLRLRERQQAMAHANVRDQPVPAPNQGENIENDNQHDQPPQEAQQGGGPKKRKKKRRTRKKRGGRRKKKTRKKRGGTANLCKLYKTNPGRVTKILADKYCKDHGDTNIPKNDRNLCQESSGNCWLPPPPQNIGTGTLVASRDRNLQVDDDDGFSSTHGGKRRKKKTRKKRGSGPKFSKPKEDTTVIEGRNAWTEDDLEVWIGDTLDKLAQKPHAKGFREIINTPFLHQYIASFLLDHTRGMDFNKAFFSRDDKLKHKELMNYRLVKVLNEIPLQGHPTYKLFKTYLEEKKKNMFLNLFNEWTVLGPSSMYHNPRGSMHKGAGLEKSRYLRMLFNIMYEVVKQAHTQKHRQDYNHSINVKRWYYREQDPDTYDRILDAIKLVTVKPPNMREDQWNEIWRRNGLNEYYAQMPYLNLINNFRWLIQPGFLKYWKWYGKFKQKFEAQKGSIPLRGKYKEESMNEGEILSKILIMTLFQYLHHYKELFIYNRMIDEPSPAARFPTFEHERKVDRRSLERFTELILLLINSPQINWNKSFNTNGKHKKTGKLTEYTYKDIYTFWLDFVEKFKEVKAKEMKLHNEAARKRFLKGINPITNFRRNYFRVTVVLMEEKDLEPIVMITKLIHEKTYPQEKTDRELDIEEGTYEGDDEQKVGGGKTPPTGEMNPKNSPQHIPPLVLPPSITVDSAEVENNSMEQIFLHNLSVSIIGLQNPNTILEILQLYQNDYNGRIEAGIQPSGNFGELLNNDIQALQNYINYLQSQQSGGCFPN